MLTILNPKAVSKIARRAFGSGKYNLLKRRALEAFDERGWLNPPAWAGLVGFKPIRAAYTYLLRLHRFGLLDRRMNSRQMVVYHISPRGRERLEWLREQTKT